MLGATCYRYWAKFRILADRHLQAKKSASQKRASGIFAQENSSARWTEICKRKHQSKFLARFLAPAGANFYTLFYTRIWGPKLVYNRCYTLIWVPCKEILYTIFTLIISCKDLRKSFDFLQVLAEHPGKSANPCVNCLQISWGLKWANSHTRQINPNGGKGCAWAQFTRLFEVTDADNI